METESKTAAAAPPLAKYLASNEKKVRDKAIKNLSQFLSDASSDALPKQEMAKLWKGIFYCFWMSDKPLIQQALAAELAELILTITTTTASLRFLRGFWEATVREWNGIDRLRIDKYYMLVRRFVNASFRLLIRAEWEQSTIDEYNHILMDQGGPLCSDDMRVPTSLAYHLADIYIEELDKALGNENQVLPAPLSPLLHPFFTLAARTQSNTTYQRIKTALFEPLISSLESRKDEPPSAKRIRLAEPDEQTYLNLIANACMRKPKQEGKLEPLTLKSKLLRVVFETASQPDTRDSNRRKLYALWKANADDADDGDSD
ncbi:Nop52-domain-containing protein [Pluteus cervinus]|uniref:Nop52-domain-containing protein n=1 Tax=Pluteus cervinus TaxID=181527 RepID=A0ACD3BI65_9AGAR|nr:Nop52-domain-containing protein [Pluteus cervinus]